jgi:hypothetical protein
VNSGNKSLVPAVEVGCWVIVALLDGGGGGKLNALTGDWK